MRYIIIGAGAIGGVVGGRLAESGADVVLVARGAHYEAIRADGLRVEGHEGMRTHPLPVVRGPEELELGPDDVLFLAVKTQDSVAALDAWAGRPVSGGGTAGERLPVVCAQNGVEGERLALRRFRRVYGMCVWLPATFLEPGLVGAPGSPLTGMLHIGRYPSGVDETAYAISRDLEKAPFEAPVVPDVMRWKYAKLLGNIGNAMEAACGVMRDEMVPLYRRAQSEGRAVLTAAGIDPIPDAEGSAHAATRSASRSWAAGLAARVPPGSRSAGVRARSRRTSSTARSRSSAGCTGCRPR